MSDDPLIAKTEGQSEEAGEARAAQAANLFDLRRIIGGVFLFWGILLTILGVTEGDAEIAKAADVNINLYAGLCMLVISAIFLVWAFTRPLGEELRESGESDPPSRTGAPAPHGVDAAALASHQRRRRSGSDDTGSGGSGDTRR